jgi:hypothetical protein
MGAPARGFNAGDDGPLDFIFLGRVPGSHQQQFRGRGESRHSHLHLVPWGQTGQFERAPAGETHRGSRTTKMPSKTGLLVMTIVPRMLSLEALICRHLAPQRVLKLEDGLDFSWRRLGFRG